MTIRYKRLTQLVYERIRRDILEGKLGSGTRIKQDELTAKLGVSRTPVREAIQRLEAEGLVQFVGRGLAMVSGITPRKIEEIFELRALLEGYAAQQAAEKVDPRTIRELYSLIKEMDDQHAEKNVERLVLKNEEFHRTICSLAGNETLVSVLEPIWRDIRRLRFNYLATPMGHQQSAREHKMLLQALERRDRIAIRKIVEAHTTRTKVGILDYLESVSQKAQEAHSVETVQVRGSNGSDSEMDSINRR